MKIDIPVGRMVIEGPKPYRVEFPFGVPGDGFRRNAREGKATCVAYHRGVDPFLIAGAVERGNQYRYGPGDDRYEEIKLSMEKDGFDGQDLIIYVDGQRTWMGEGNHRLMIANDAGLRAVNLQIRYLNRVDEEFLLLPFDWQDPEIRVVSD